MLALRDLCNVNGDNARFWALYGAQCERSGHAPEALEAYNQALWLRERERDARRADALRRVIARVQLSAA
jgi:Flp pilus assembly protein TadD